MKVSEKSYLAQYFSAFNVMQLISRTDADGIIISANKNFCKLSGYSQEELIGQSHSMIRHPDMKDIVFEKIWQTISSGKIWKGEIKNLTKTNKFYWTKSIIFPIFDDSRKIVEYVSFREDITSKKKQELKSQQEENFRKEILNAQPNMAILVHRKKGVIFMNNQCFINLPFTSKADFLKDHECICELFIEEDSFLRMSTPDRHWLEDFNDFPDRKHKANLLQRDKQEQVYDVNIQEFKDNKDLIVVNFLKVFKVMTFEDSLKEEEAKIRDLKFKISVAISTIASMEDNLTSSDEIERLGKIKALLKE